MFMHFNCDNAGSAMFWVKIYYVGVSFIPASVYALASSFHKNKNNLLMISGYFIGLIFCLLNIAGILVKEVRYIPNWNYYIEIGNTLAYYLFVTYFIAFFLLSFIRFYKNYKNEKSLLQKKRYKF